MLKASVHYLLLAECDKQFICRLVNGPTQSILKTNRMDKNPKNIKWFIDDRFVNDPIKKWDISFCLRIQLLCNRILDISIPNWLFVKFLSFNFFFFNSNLFSLSWKQEFDNVDKMFNKIFKNKPSRHTTLKQHRLNVDSINGKKRNMLTY